TDPTGFDAIGVSLLGNNTATGMLLASLLFGGLRQGSTQMQLNANIPVDLVFIIQALVLFSIASEFLPAILRALPVWVPFSRKPALVVTGSTTVAKQNGDSAEKEGVTVQARSQQEEES
ncbi:MAG: ABC transporter permease, partial [Ktedonobacteraceae bacterium]|nr:ABC transporter permease [Ktedonobacteraceae bacterium]